MWSGAGDFPCLPLLQRSCCESPAQAREVARLHCLLNHLRPGFCLHCDPLSLAACTALPDAAGFWSECRCCNDEGQLALRPIVR